MRVFNLFFLDGKSNWDIYTNSNVQRNILTEASKGVFDINVPE